MIVNTDHWDSYNVGTVLPTVGAAYTVSAIGTAPTVGAMPATNVRQAMYAKVKPPDPKKNNSSRVCFRVYSAAGYGSKGFTGGAEIYHDSIMKSSPSSAQRAATCAEYHLYEKIKDDLSNHGYLVVTQDLAPCRQCISSYSGLAASKDLTIMVYFAEGYDILKRGPGILLFDPTGTAYWFD